ncbi:helix-turn-helix transcriptional regulator [Microbacterium sp. NPDC057407]|uniref:helix-turn-helix transcriptional regulator n=1 Tax=Microbacterium sp. NPDC057407 TaxID=3346120 RepID=UPI003671BB5C
MNANDSLSLEMWGLEQLLDINELAAYLRVPVSTIYEWRMKGRAPRAHRYGKHLTFAVSDVRAWVDAQREPEASPLADRR